VNNRFNEIQAIEPDAVNLSRLRRNLDGIDGIEKQRIRVLPVAVGDEEGDRRFFEGLGYASQFCDLGERLVDVKTLDRLAMAPTFLKLHLEGWELDALKGGLTTLAHYRPLIAATTYHNCLGLWRLPKWLMDHLPNYEFLLRLHSWCGTGSVIYAIPNERCRSVVVR
jgi:FkbM family methyltransferase